MEILQTLGEGSFGTVHRVRVHGEQEELACKLFEGQYMSFMEDIQQEIEIMSILRSKATPLTPIVRMHAFHIAVSPDDPEPSFITMDLCRGGSLRDLLALRPILTEQDAALVISNIAKALVFCHLQARVLHLDVKPANILFLEKDRLDSARLADFGLSVQIIGDGDSMYNRPGAVGTPAFLAPEAKVHGHYSTAADTWSLGAVLFRMLMGHNPQSQRDDSFVVNFEEEGDAWKSLSALARNLLQGMLCPDPDLRLTLPQVLCNPWVLLKGTYNTSMLNPAATPTVIARPHAALRCPPGFENVAVKKISASRSKIMAAGPKSTICQGNINPLQQTPGVIQDKRGIDGFVRKMGPSCPPGFEMQLDIVAKKMNACHLQSSILVNQGPPSAIHHDKLAANGNGTGVHRAVPLCPPGFSFTYKTSNTTGCLQSTYALQQQH